MSPLGRGVQHQGSEGDNLPVDPILLSNSDLLPDFEDGAVRDLDCHVTLARFFGQRGVHRGSGSFRSPWISPNFYFDSIIRLFALIVMCVPVFLVVLVLFAPVALTRIVLVIILYLSLNISHVSLVSLAHVFAASTPCRCFSRPAIAYYISLHHI